MIRVADLLCIWWTMPKTKTMVALRLDTELRDGLRALALQRGVSAATLLREAIIEKLAAELAEVTR